MGRTLVVGGEVVSRMLFGRMLHSKAAWKNGFLYVFVEEL